MGSPRRGRLLLPGCWPERCTDSPSSPAGPQSTRTCQTERQLLIVQQATTGSHCRTQGWQYSQKHCNFVTRLLYHFIALLAHGNATHKVSRSLSGLASEGLKTNITPVVSLAIAGQQASNLAKQQQHYNTKCNTRSTLDNQTHSTLQIHESLQLWTIVLDSNVYMETSSCFH